jgi:DNA gyrase subunit A
MAEEIHTTLIEQEMKESYLDYAMSVIVSRALPDVKDGLKPVQRRILFAMKDMGLLNNKPYAKSARIVGECFKYHPHGDTSIYDALVRMAQNWVLRYPLVQGHGNFGSIDGDPAAAMRYSEARLHKISAEMLKDLDKNSVDFVPNFDGSLNEPVLLPAVVPNLLLNGCSGIAVGMATNIPPHNLREVVDAVIDYTDNPNIEIDALIQKIPGPDFPTGGIICGKQGVINAYTTGKGKIIVRAKVEIDEDKRKIVVTQIPYAVNKSLLLKNIADLVRNKVIQGISDLRDDSDRNGMSIVIELKRDYNINLILNQLYKHTQLQTTFGVQMLALIDNRPKLLNLKQIIEQYVLHRKNVIYRTTKFDLDKAEHKAHVLEGLKIALKNIDSVIKLIKESNDVDVARKSLIVVFTLTEIQSNAILEMRLQRLTSLETKKIEEDYLATLEVIKNLKQILSSEQEILKIIKDELLTLKNDYGDDRRTAFGEITTEIEKVDLIKQIDIVVTITNKGFIKQIPLDTYRQQRRGGAGVTAAGSTSDDDFVEHLFITDNHNHLLFFTKFGKAYGLRAYDIPEAGRQARGKAMVSLFNLEEKDFVTSVLPVKEFSDNQSVVFVTKNGVLKKTLLSEYANPRKSGIKAISLDEGDNVVDVALTDGTKEIMLFTKDGMAVRFKEDQVRNMGRNAGGVTGVKLREKDQVVSMEVCNSGITLMTVTENGFGKRTELNEYRLTARGGIGVTNIKVSEKNGNVVSVKAVSEDDEVLIITEKGILIRINVKDVSKIGRNTQGNKLIRLYEGDRVANLAKIVKE